VGGRTQCWGSGPERKFEKKGLPRYPRCVEGPARGKGGGGKQALSHFLVVTGIWKLRLRGGGGGRTDGEDLKKKKSKIKKTRGRGGITRMGEKGARRGGTGCRPEKQKKKKKTKKKAGPGGFIKKEWEEGCNSVLLGYCQNGTRKNGVDCEVKGKNPWASTRWRSRGGKTVRKMAAMGGNSKNKADRRKNKNPRQPGGPQLWVGEKDWGEVEKKYSSMAFSLVLSCRS